MDDPYNFLIEQNKLLEESIELYEDIKESPFEKYSDIWNHLDKLIQEIEIEEIKSHIEVLQVKEDNERLYRFLHKKFYRDELSVQLWDTHKKNSIPVNNWINQMKPRIIYDLYFILSQLNHIVQSANPVMQTSIEHLIPVSSINLDEIQMLSIPEIKNNTKPQEQDLIKPWSIPTTARPEEILSFWLKLLGKNEKGEPYWNSKAEIEHFVNQNFEEFPGVIEIKIFDPNMGKTDLYHFTHKFFTKYGLTKSKSMYATLLAENFLKITYHKSLKKNIDSYHKPALDRLLK